MKWMVCCLAWALFIVPLAAHPPQDLMNVSFELRKGALFCTAEVHYGELYSLQRKQGGQVKEKDYPAILRSFHMNCPLKVDGALIEPSLVSFDRPGKDWGMHYLDHALPDEEIRIARIVLEYPCSSVPELVEVEWNLIPRNMASLKIPFVHDGEKTMREATRAQPKVVWKPASVDPKQAIAGSGIRGGKVASSEKREMPSSVLGGAAEMSDAKDLRNVPVAAGVSGALALIVLAAWALHLRKNHLSIENKQ